MSSTTILSAARPPDHEGDAYCRFIEYLTRAYQWHDATHPHDIDNFDLFNAEATPFQIEDVWELAESLFTKQFPMFCITRYYDADFTICRTREYVQLKYSFSGDVFQNKWSVRQKLADVLERNHGASNFLFEQRAFHQAECDYIAFEIEYFSSDRLRGCFNYWGLCPEDWLVGFDMKQLDKGLDRIAPQYHIRIPDGRSLWIQVWIKQKSGECSHTFEPKRKSGSRFVCTRCGFIAPPNYQPAPKRILDLTLKHNIARAMRWLFLPWAYDFKKTMGYLKKHPKTASIYHTTFNEEENDWWYWSHIEETEA
jgi:hypothetical protein